MSKKPKYHISQDAMLVSTIDSLSNIVFAETVEEKENHLAALQFKLSILIPDSLETEREKFVCMLVQLVGSFARLEDIEIQAMQKLIFIGCDDSKKLDMRLFNHSEEGLKEFVEKFILPPIFNMGIDLKTEFAELEGLQTQLQRDDLHG